MTSIDSEAVLIILRERSEVSPAGCWVWQRARAAHGYGQAWIHGRRYAAHRAALAAKLGRWLEPGECALHRCDNPPCCNPDHVFLGSNADNLDDAAAKGRLSGVPWQRVMALLGQGMTKAAVASAVGCDTRTVFRIAKRYGGPGTRLVE